MASNTNPAVGEAYAKLQVISADERNRMLYEARLKAQRDERSRLRGAKNEGRAEGKAEGKIEGHKEALDRFYELLDKGISPEEIKEVLASGAFFISEPTPDYDVN